MYCIKCGVKLADTETTCPLCNTTVYHPDLAQQEVPPLYPRNKLPETTSGSKGLHGAVIFLFLIPILVCIFADMSLDGHLEWSGFVAGALAVVYVTLALPLWFRKPNPVIFTPCNFVAVGLYLQYINWAIGGNWFFTFALPVTGGLCLITSALVTLLYYVRKGRLYIVGGTLIALGGFMLLVEYLMYITFGIWPIGWSVYPLVVLFLFGGQLIYFAINRSAWEILKRKLFF